MSCQLKLPFIIPTEASEASLIFPQKNYFHFKGLNLQENKKSPFSIEFERMLQEKERQEKERQEKWRQEKERQEKWRQEKERQEKERQEKERQEKERQEKIPKKPQPNQDSRRRNISREIKTRD